MSEAIWSTLEAHDEKKSSDMGGHHPNIILFVDHKCPDMSYSLYTIKPPHDISEYDQLVDSEGFMSQPISPVLTFQEKNNFLLACASINLGSKVYYLGGWFDIRGGSSADQDLERLTYQVQVFDTDHPELEMQLVAPMHGPKLTPCVFSADGMIYALGSALQNVMNILPGCKGTGVFERYDPISDQWHVLPDPPLPYVKWKRVNFLDRATVVGRRVFIGSSIYLVFNLDTQEWDPVPPSKIAARFPYGSLFVKDSNSLYQLTGFDAWKPGTKLPGDFSFTEPLMVVKKGPLATTEESSLLKDPCLDAGNEQVMAEVTDLDENKRFTNRIYGPWRDLIHMGGRFFCYIVTAQLVDWADTEHYFEPYSRAVWIKFFEEVPAPADNNNNTKTKFRPLASFCYKIKTNFRNASSFIRCSVLGTVPDSWINAPPPKEKQESKLKHGIKEQDQSLVIEKERLDCESENSDDLKKLLTAQEEKINSLAAELAWKNDLLKAYEALMAKPRGMVES